MVPFIRLTQTGASLPGQGLVKARDYQAWLDAEALLVEARERAAEIEAQALEEAKACREQGYREGLRQGKQVMAEQMMACASRTVNHMANAEDGTVRTVMMALRKIIGQWDDDDLIRRIVREVLALGRDQHQVKLRVAPGEVETVKATVDELLERYTTISLIEVVPDGRMDRGGCFLETETGVVDAGIETQLAAIERSLRRSFGQARGMTGVSA